MVNLKNFIVIILLLLTLVGCGNQNFSKDNQTPVSGKIMVDKVEYEMRVGKYQWNGENAKIKMIDEISPVEIAKDFDTLTLEKNKTIDIVIEKNPDLTVYQWSEDGKVQEIALTENQIIVPSPQAMVIIYTKWWGNGMMEKHHIYLM